MQVIAVYSESGGVSKTTHAVSLAVVAARQGRGVVLIDLDPRAAATKWSQVQPAKPGYHVGAILAQDDVAGYADELAVPSPWSPNLRVVPSARNVSNREGEHDDGAEYRLKRSLDGLAADVVIIDCPNRQGGPLIKGALTAAGGVVYAARPNADGIDGVEGARRTVTKFRENRALIGADPGPEELGIIVGAITTTIVPAVERVAVDDLRATGLLLTPMVPKRTIVEQVRLTGEWFGDYRAGRTVVDAYTELTRKVIP